jgi:putative heme-binding domain-containing protein
MSNTTTSIAAAIAVAVAAALLIAADSRADSVTAKAADNSVAAEQASFELHEDFEINLFADESMGIANPIAMHWDTRGRLWLLTTMAYAQLTPGETTDDKIFILEDSDGDGHADKIKTFADGLNMPIGFALGDGGIWIGEGDKLLFLPDRDGDDVADGREVVLRGFGIGDTHQNISNFTWGPDGCLYFCQGLHSYSRVETPWGIVRGDTAGFFRFDPREQRLEPFCFPSMASQNPCGIAFDKRGAMFLKSNNKELIFVTPGLVPTTHPRNLVPIANIGATPGKSMGGEYVESAHLPDWLQNHVLIAGYYSHRVTAFPLVEDGAGYAPVEPVELMVAGHSSFRPVDIRIGPDGAIYVADWFNPIIGHYQASLRHPDRDKLHGRIWRMTAKDRPLLKEMPAALKREPWKVSEEFTDQQKRLLESDFADLEPFERLQKVIALANRAEPDSLQRLMHALDHEPDRFIDYALRQAVHTRADGWLDAGEPEDLELDAAEHLAFVLGEYGGPNAAALARSALKDRSMAGELRGRFAAILARLGSAKDILEIIEADEASDALFSALAISKPVDELRRSEKFVNLLVETSLNGEPVEAIAALRVIGAWKIEGADRAFPTHRLYQEHSDPISAETLLAYAKVRGKAAVQLLSAVAKAEKFSPEHSRDAIAALALVDLPAAAAASVQVFAAAGDDEQLVASLLDPFLKRKNGTLVLSRVFDSANLEKAAATSISLALKRQGRNDPELAKVLDTAIGETTEAQAYSPAVVAKLVEAVREGGDAKAGSAIFHRAELTCVACHQLGGVGGILGPSLDTVGAGLPLDLVVESVLWPQRQLKEGYFALGVTTKDGAVFTGYKESEQAGILRLKDPASATVHPIPVAQITERKNLGSLMPAGLAASLKPDELRDLIAYLAGLKGQK